MLYNIFILIVGFVFLIKGADVFVDGASSTASNFKVSKMLIGLTIVAFGTSAPEFAVSMQALSAGSSDMVLGNVIGSNITNVLLILGIGAMIHPIAIKENTVRKELPLCMLISTLLAVLFLDVKLGGGTINEITRADAIVILLFFTIFVYYLIALSKTKSKKNEVEKPKYSLFKSLVLVVIGLLAIIAGSNAVVSASSNIARMIGMSDRMISLTILAIGTSLPELVTTITSSLKGEQDILIGNIIGSNIFNICVVLGIPVAIYGTITVTSFQMIDIYTLILTSIVLYIFSKTKRGISRLEGLLLFLGFITYYVLIFII